MGLTFSYQLLKTHIPRGRKPRAGHDIATRQHMGGPDQTVTLPLKPTISVNRNLSMLDTLKLERELQMAEVHLLQSEQLTKLME